MTEPVPAGVLRPARHVTVVGSQAPLVVGDAGVHRVVHPLAAAALHHLIAAGAATTGDVVGAVIARMPGASTDDVTEAIRGLLGCGAVVTAPEGDEAVDRLPAQVHGLADAMRARRGRPHHPEPVRGSATTTMQVRTTAQRRRGSAIPVPREPAPSPRPARIRVVVVAPNSPSVQGAGPSAHAATITSALRRHGFDVDDDPQPAASAPAPTVTIVVAGSLLAAGVADAVTGALAAGGAALVVAVSTSRALLGPVLRPRETDPTGPCPDCLRLHLHRATRPRAARARAASVGDVVLSAATVPPLVGDLAAALAVALVVDVLATGGPRGPRRDVLEVDAAGIAVHRHAVTARPQCPTCGDPALVAARIREPLRPAPRPVSLAAGYRSGDVDAFLDATAHLVGPVTGLVDRIRATARCGPFHTARGSHGVVPLGDGWQHAPALGKGLTAEAARAGVIGEAVERASLAAQGDEPTVRACLADLGDDAVAPETFLLFSDAQYDHVDGALTAPHDRVPHRLPVDLPVQWTPMWSLTSSRSRLVPTAAVLFGHPEAGFVAPDSNGCAAGATIEDAVWQGLLELVERDAVGIWWYGRVPRPAVAASRLGVEAASLLARVRRGVADAGRDVWLLDLTTDLGIPVVAAVSARRLPGDGGGQAICFGFGAHADVDLAASRALGELAQLLAIGPEAASPLDRIRQPQAEHFWRTATLAGHPYLAPHADAVPAPIRIAPAGDLAVDIAAVVGLLAGAGMETLVADLTRPDLGVPVARVLVPGLRHFWPRLAPGRLYDVPAALRWVTRAPREATCNPVALFV